MVALLSLKMIENLEEELRPLVNFERITRLETIQSLWSGYGSLLRIWLSGSESPSVIVKHIAPPAAAKHPRGWNSNIGHQRKLRSYEVEAAWYQHFNHRTNKLCRTPQLLGFKQLTGHSLLVLEDLDSAGFKLRKSKLNSEQIRHCLSWLAAFHAQFMNEEPVGLWKIGTYWQLDTRPEEFETMAKGPLKAHARAIHESLNQARFQTLVHGDAKYANFCFSKRGAVAAVDFQYIGRGCGMKDVAYLLSCIEGGITSVTEEEALLSRYFSILQTQLKAKATKLDFAALEKEWRTLYAFAWADFERFLLGWAPGHWKSSEYSAYQVAKALDLLAT